MIASLAITITLICGVPRELSLTRDDGAMIRLKAVPSYQHADGSWAYWPKGDMRDELMFREALHSGRAKITQVEKKAVCAANVVTSN